MERAVLIGGSPSALLAAAVLAERGVAVRVLSRSGDVMEGPGLPPWGRGAYCVRDAAGRAALESALGGVVPHPEPTRGVWWKENLHPLPFRRRDTIASLGAARAGNVARDLFRIRARGRLDNVVSMGTEQRSYERWLVSRIGESLYGELHRGYARNRFAADPREVLPILAWRTVAREAPREWVCRGLDPAGFVDAVRERILEAGGELLEDVEVESLEVEGGRIRAVETSVGRELVEDVLFVDVPPGEVVSWLPEEQVDAKTAFQTARLVCGDRLQVTLRADAEALPWACHLAVEGGPAWLLTRPGLLPGCARWIGHVTAHVTLAPGEEAADVVERVREQLGALVSLRGGEPFVQRLAGATPMLNLVAQPALGHVLGLFDRLGIVGVGRGAFRDLEAWEHLTMLQQTLDCPPPTGRREPKRVVWQRDAHRVVAERPVRLPDQFDARLIVSD